jgi:predicted dehydrogenase
MPDRIRIGILGCARICRRAIIAAIRRSESAELVSIASRKPAVASAWAAEFGIPKAHASYAELVADPAVDAVYIPLPNDEHKPWTLRAAAAGKHVLCEKPLALDAAEAAEMVDASHAHGVILMEAFMWRHHPRVEHTRQLLADGTLGDLRLVKMDFSFDIDRSDWRLDPRQGGGALYDLGCYGINAARLFTRAEPLEQFARWHLNERGADMTVGFELRFANDVIALLDGSFECPDRFRIEIVGTRGAVELPEGVLPSPRTTLNLTTAEGKRAIEFPDADQYAVQIDAFCQGIRTGTLPDPAENGLANMKVIDAVRAAARQGR